jgi:hypothetical protein
MIENNENWIAGDGGPIVILQSGALPFWKGATNFDQSIMNGGSLETDYDVICGCDNHHTYRYNRDMLVLDDSEWSARIFRLENGTIIVEQSYYMSEEFPNVVQQVAQTQPKQTFSITIEDNRLRLLVGADSADGNLYGFSEIDIVPGLKRCDVYSFDNVLVIKISTLEKLA